MELNECCESEGNGTVEDQVFGNRCPQQYENGDCCNSREDSLPKENPEVLGSLIRLSNLLKGSIFPIPRFISKGGRELISWLLLGSVPLPNKSW